MATLSETIEVLKSLANARLHYLEDPEDAADFDSDTIAADLKIGISTAMKDGLAMAAEMVAAGNRDAPLTAEDSAAVGNFHVLRRNVLSGLNPPPPNRADRRREEKVSRKSK